MLCKDCSTENCNGSLCDFRSLQPAQLIISIRTKAVISCCKNVQSDKQIVQTCISESFLYFDLSFEDIGEKSLSKPVQLTTATDLLLDVIEA